MSHENKDQLGLDRIAFFSDAVMAIAITLLVIDLRLPDRSHGELFSQLALLQGRLLGYFISFMMVASFWEAHHRMFRYFQTYDRRFLWLNNFFLMFIAFLPFPTSIIGKGLDSQGAVFYIANIAAIGLLRFAMWHYATRKSRLVASEFPVTKVREEMWRALATPVGFLLTIPVAIINARFVGWCWLLIWCVTLYLSARKWRGS